MEDIKLSNEQVAELMYLKMLGYKYLVGQFDNKEFITCAYENEPKVSLENGAMTYSKQNNTDMTCRTHLKYDFMMKYVPLEIEHLISNYIILDRRDIKIIHD